MVMLSAIIPDANTALPRVLAPNTLPPKLPPTPPPTPTTQVVKPTTGDPWMNMMTSLVKGTQTVEQTLKDLAPISPVARAIIDTAKGQPLAIDLAIAKSKLQNTVTSTATQPIGTPPDARAPSGLSKYLPLIAIAGAAAGLFFLLRR